jgi:desulfoferrodoxin (superoxide reductase-like protein)
MVLEYDFASQVLYVTITHNSPTTSNHYVETVELFKNGIAQETFTYQTQPDRSTFTYEYPVTGQDGDLLEAMATCNIYGSLTRNTTVVGPKERMRMELAPRPTSIGSGMDVDFTVNLYSAADDMPLDGARVVAVPELGSVTDVEPLALGGYTFTYTAPSIIDDVAEELNISASKNGYHTIYQELLFDIVSETTPRIQVSILPILYKLDEGEMTTFSVRVRSGTQDLDVEDITVERSGGEVEKKKVSKGQFTLEYTPEEVASDTNAFIQVRAEMEGYLPGEKRLDFVISDIPDTPGNGDGGSGPSSLTNTILLIGTILVLGAALSFVIYMVWKKRSARKGSADDRVTAKELGPER